MFQSQEAPDSSAAFSAADPEPLLEWIAFLLVAPSVFLTLPPIYFAGGMAWQVRDAMPGEPIWPVP